MSSTTETAEPVLLAGTRDWTGEGLTVTRDEAAVVPTLGQVSPVMVVTGPAALARTILRMSVPPEMLVGIDDRSIRVFRLGRADQADQIVTDSAYAPGVGFVWAAIDAPGRYVAVGLASDQVIRNLLGSLATARAMSAPATPRAMLVDQMTASPLRSMTPAQFNDLRAAYAADNAATMADPRAAVTARRGHAGRIEPGDLPGGLTADAFLTRLQGLMAEATELPEERLIRDGFAAVDLSSGAAVAWGAAGTAVPPVPRAPGIPASANWWMYHRDPQHSGAVADSHIDRANVAHLRLRYRLQLDGPVVSVPAVVDNTIYVAIGNSRRAIQQRGGTLYAVDLPTGVIRTSFTLNTPPLGGARQGMAGIACTPAVVGGRLYFSALNGCIYCLDAFTLTPIWITDLRHADPLHNQPITHTVAAAGWSSPLVVNGCVYVGFGESESNAFGFVYCLDAVTGVVRWLFCTTLFPGMAENEPNLVPQSAVGLFPLPPLFQARRDPPSRGGSPWSSVAYDPVTGRIFVGTGNVLPQGPVPQPKYALGLLSLDAATGRNPRFFQPANADNYRPGDSDCDVAAGPLLYRDPVDGRRYVAIGSKNGSFFVLEADTLVPVAKRQLLPRIGGNGGFPGDNGQPVATIDPHPLEPDGSRSTENFYGVFSTASVSYARRRLYVGVGGFAFGIGSPGIDTASTAFLRALDWNDLTDQWPTEVGPDQIRRYTMSTPPMYTTPGESGFSSPVLVNGLVLLSTSRPALYAFDQDTGLCLWSAPGFGPVVPNSFTLGPVVFGDYVIVGSANLGLLVFSL